MPLKPLTVKVTSWLVLSAVAAWVINLFSPWYFGLAAVVLIVLVGASLLLLRGRARIVGTAGAVLAVAAAVTWMVWAGRYTVTIENKSGQPVGGLLVLADDRHALTGAMRPGQRGGFWFVELGGPHQVVVMGSLLPEGKDFGTQVHWAKPAAAPKPRTMHLTIGPGGDVESRFE